MVSAQTIDRARKNGVSGGQFVGQGGCKINVDQVVDLLVDAAQGGHIGLRQPANAMLADMAQFGTWRLTAARHRGGLGGGGRGRDLNDHITVNIHEEGYHLQVTLDGHIRDITGPAQAQRIPPWLPPGAAI